MYMYMYIDYTWIIVLPVADAKDETVDGKDEVVDADEDEIEMVNVN